MDVSMKNYHGILSTGVPNQKTSKMGALVWTAVFFSFAILFNEFGVKDWVDIAMQMR